MFSLNFSDFVMIFNANNTVQILLEDKLFNKIFRETFYSYFMQISLSFIWKLVERDQARNDCDIPCKILQLF